MQQNIFEINNSMQQHFTWSEKRSWKSICTWRNGVTKDQKQQQRNHRHRRRLYSFSIVIQFIFDYRARLPCIVLPAETICQQSTSPFVSVIFQSDAKFSKNSINLKWYWFHFTSKMLLEPFVCAGNCHRFARFCRLYDNIGVRLSFRMGVSMFQLAVIVMLLQGCRYIVYTLFNWNILPTSYLVDYYQFDRHR